MRRDDWPERLAVYVDGKQRAPFAWGKHDCCTFAAGAVHAMTGKHHMAEFRGKYKDEGTAQAALQSIGKGSLYHTLRGKFGNPIKPAMAQRGDLMMADVEGTPALLICLGQVSVGPGPDGLVRLPTLSCNRGWRI
jgi:hypothetical protein